MNPNSFSYAGLAGLSLGNPVISCVSADYNAIQMNLFYWHALVSHLVYANWTSNGCNDNSNLPNCNSIFATAISQIGVINQQLMDITDQPSLDPDDLYQDWCTGNGTLEFAVDGVDYPSDCNPIGNRMTTYLNRPDVQQAIGARPTQWVSCTGSINYNTSGASMIPLYRSFIQKRPDINILVYSGDVDIYTVPFGYTKACLAELDEVPVNTWQPWFVNGATAGYVEQFPHYTYATVKGGGHETPAYQPLSSYYMMQQFLTTGTITPKKPKLSGKKAFSVKNQGHVLRERKIRV